MKIIKPVTKTLVPGRRYQSSSLTQLSTTEELSEHGEEYSYVIVVHNELSQPIRKQIQHGGLQADHHGN